MNLTVRVLGVEVLQLTTTPPPPEPQQRHPPDSVHSHDGLFEIGFQPTRRWSHTWREDEGP